MNFATPNVNHEKIRCKKCKRQLVGDFDGRFQHMMRYHAIHMVGRIPALMTDSRLPAVYAGLIMQFVESWELWK